MVFVIRKTTKTTYSKNQSETKRIPHNLPPMHLLDSQDELKLITFTTSKATKPQLYSNKQHIQIAACSSGCVHITTVFVLTLTGQNMRVANYRSSH